MEERYLHPWLPNLSRIKEALEKIGLREIDELFQAIPSELFVRDRLGISPERPLKPWEIESDFQRKAETSLRLPLNRIFAGGPVCPHYTHPAVQYVISRGEFLTAYTPYQPEINQGVLQALYEYQSLMAELLGVEVVNAGMYDGATSLAEALLMAIRLTGKREILLPKTLYDEYKSVVETYMIGPAANVRYYEIDERGQPMLEDIARHLREGEIAGVVAENPTGHGVINEMMEEIYREASSRGALSIALVEPLLMGIVRPPGELGYEVVVAEGQSLGLPMNGGGPLLGVFGIKYEQRLLRQLPGRLIGATVDAEGKRGFMMILQTREQHIRREKATSNITTNTALNAIGAAVHLSLLGDIGLKWLASYILNITNYAVEMLSKAGHTPLYEGATYFKNVAYKLSREIDAGKLASEKGVLPFSPYSFGCLSCFTEVHTKEDIEYLVKSLEVM